MNSQEITIDKYFAKFMQLSEIPNNLKAYTSKIRVSSLPNIPTDVKIIIEQNIYDSILGNIKAGNIGDDVFINTTEYGIEHVITRNKISEIIQTENKKFAITNISISNILQDSSLFNYAYVTNFNSINNHANLYSLGDIHRTNIYVDPYMSYNDNRIILLDEIFINIQNIHISNNQINEYIVNFDYDYYIKSGKVINIITSKDCKAYLKFKSKQRDMRIDSILN